MSFEDIRYQLVNEPLGTLTALDHRRSFAKRDENFEFTYSLKARVSYFSRPSSFSSHCKLDFTIGTRASDELYPLTEPLAASFPFPRIFVALHSRSRSDLSKAVVELVADKTAIFCNACWRILRAIFSGEVFLAGTNKARNSSSRQVSGLHRQIVYANDNVDAKTGGCRKESNIPMDTVKLTMMRMAPSSFP